MRVFNWNSDKNQLLMNERRISFEEIIFHIQNGGLLDDIVHPNREAYPNQNIFVININDRAYLVPYVESDTEIFLKTAIPGRKFTKLYLKGAKKDERS